VARLGEVSHNGLLFTLDSDLTITEVIFELPKSFHGEGYALILAKMNWVTLWAIFSQAHLVTLRAKNSFLPNLSGSYFA
jgi:hypothetical protein